MRMSDGSSDVCSSDLSNPRTPLVITPAEKPPVEEAAHRPIPRLGRLAVPQKEAFEKRFALGVHPPALRGAQTPAPLSKPGPLQAVDRTSVVSGKSVSVRVDLGGRRIIKKNKKE